MIALLPVHQAEATVAVLLQRFAVQSTQRDLLFFFAPPLDFVNAEERLTLSTSPREGCPFMFVAGRPHEPGCGPRQPYS